MKSNKKRILLVLAILTMALVLSCAFVACDKAGTDKTGTDIAADYKVTIHPNNGQSDIVWDITKEIPTITKDGYHIAGYFLDAQLTISTTLESLKATGITKNIDVYVKWEEDVCEHVEATDVAVEPTCTEKGLTEGKHCSKCGKILQAQNEIPALGHDLETHNGQEATCTEKGWEAYDTCKRDGCTYTTYQEIDALGHDIEHHVGQPAICTEKGWEAYDTCKRDGCTYTTYQEIPALNHDIEHHVGKPATCTEKGWEAYVTCKRDGCTYTTYKEIAALGHDLETHNGQEATCTEKGWKEYVTCKREGCDHTTYEEIPALGHTGGTATCTEQATCERCNEKYGNALGHNYGDLIPKTEPTCSATGLEAHYKCSVCNKVFKDDEHKTETTLDDLTIAINPAAHNFGEWIKNEGTDTHTRVCSFNNEHTETENCHGGTATCTEQAVCEKCNAKYGELVKHNYKDGVCIVCGIRRPSEGLGYSLNSDGIGYTVTGIGTCTDKELIIPSEYNAKPVTSIGKDAFRFCSGLTSITIPDSVTSIGDYAFNGCTGLTSIEVPNSVTTIPAYAFNGCTGLTSITIPDSVTSIGEGAFLFCTSLTSVTIPDSVTSMGVGAFNGCSGLTSIIVVEGNSKYHSEGNCIIETETKTLILGCKTSVIPTDGSVTSIGEYAFALYTGLTSITIPDSVTSIDVAAFAYCTGLSSITIPDSVTSIGESAFSGCSELTSIIVVEGNSKYHSEGNCIIETETKTLILGCKTSDIPTDGSVTSIGDWAFAYCTGLSSITIPDSVTSIGSFAFYECTGLTSITIPNSVTSIGDWAFAYCRSLTSITIPNSVTSIGSDAFYGCIGLTSIIVVEGNTKYHSAGNCLIETATKTLILGCKTSDIPTDGSVTSIGKDAFYFCRGLTSVTIGGSVTSIGENAFYNCTGLTSITFNGTIAQWRAISKGNNWKDGVPGACKVICTDGTISISEA